MLIWLRGWERSLKLLLRGLLGGKRRILLKLLRLSVLLVRLLRYRLRGVKRLGLRSLRNRIYVITRVWPSETEGEKGVWLVC